MKRLCRQCGSEIEEGLKFCENCGHPVEVETEATLVSPPEPPSVQRREPPPPPPVFRASSTPPPPVPTARPVPTPPPPVQAAPPVQAVKTAPKRQQSAKTSRKGCWIIGGLLLAGGFCLAAVVFGGMMLKNLPGVQIPFLTNLPPVFSQTYTPYPLPATEAPAPAAIKEFTDDFSNPGSGWEVSSNDRHVQGYSDHNTYGLIATEDNTTVYAVAPMPFEKPYSNMNVTFRGREVRGANTSFGLRFRIKDEANYYYMAISGNMLTVKKVINGKWTALTNPEWAPIDGFNPNQDGYLTVEVNYHLDVIRVSVDNVRQAMIKDGDLSEGEVALFVDSSGPSEEETNEGSVFGQAEFQLFTASIP